MFYKLTHVLRDILFRHRIIEHLISEFRQYARGGVGLNLTWLEFLRYKTSVKNLRDNTVLAQPPTDGLETLVLYDVCASISIMHV